MTETRSRHRRRAGSGALGVALAVAGIIGFTLVAHVLTRRQPVESVVTAAAAQEHLAFQGTTRWVQGGGSGQFQVTGVAEPFGPMTVTIRGMGAGSPDRLAGPDPEVRYRIAWPEVEAVADLPGASTANPAPGVPAEVTSPPTLEPAAIAWHLPAGDPLGLVAAAHGSVVGDVEFVGNRRCERIDFRVAGRAYADWLRGHPALPANGGVSGLERLEGRGSVWRDVESDLPCRIAVTVALPRFAGANPGEGSADWIYAVP